MNKSATSSVSRLLRSSSPAAIILAVSFLIIFSIQCSAAGSFSHIFKESLEAGCPSVAYRNSTSSIVLEVLPVLSGASSYHLDPRFIRLGSAHSMGCSPCFYDLAPKASAREGRSICKMLSPNYFSISTITFSNPSLLRKIRSFRMEDDKPAESHPGSIDESGMALDLSTGIIDHRISFFHSISMFGVSEPPATTGGFRASGCQV